MITFKEYLLESSTSTKTMTPSEMKDHLGNGKFNAVVKHAWFHDHFHNKEVLGMQHRKTDTGLESVIVAHGPIGANKPLRRMGEFHLSASGRKIDNVHIFHNNDNEMHNGKLVWKHVKSYNEGNE